MSSTTTQNVVTYPVVVEAPNPDLKLLPGMTASLSFHVGEVKDTLRLPNSALRFYPPREKVRPEDRKILDGVQPDSAESDAPQVKLSAKEKAQGRKDTHHRYVWVEDGDFLRAIPVTTGLSDSKHTQLIAGDLSAGQKLVIGVQAAE
jgi:HlyD family secretion protein